MLRVRLLTSQPSIPPPLFTSPLPTHLDNFARLQQRRVGQLRIDGNQGGGGGLEEQGDAGQGVAGLDPVRAAGGEEEAREEGMGGGGAGRQEKGTGEQAGGWKLAQHLPPHHPPAGEDAGGGRGGIHTWGEGEGGGWEGIRARCADS